MKFLLKIITLLLQHVLYTTLVVSVITYNLFSVLLSNDLIASKIVNENSSEIKEVVSQTVEMVSASGEVGTIVPNQIIKIQELFQGLSSSQTGLSINHTAAIILLLAVWIPLIAIMGLNQYPRHAMFFRVFTPIILGGITLIFIGLTLESTLKKLIMNLNSEIISDEIVNGLTTYIHSYSIHVLTYGAVISIISVIIFLIGRRLKQNYEKLHGYSA